LANFNRQFRRLIGMAPRDDWKLRHPVSRDIARPPRDDRGEFNPNPVWHPACKLARHFEEIGKKGPEPDRSKGLAGTETVGADFGPICAASVANSRRKSDIGNVLVTAGGDP
jgi:hypothetical protein